MVVRDSHIVCVVILPAQNDAPLPVDSDGMEACEISRECLKIVAERMKKLLEFGGMVDGGQFDFRPDLDITGEFSGKIPEKTCEVGLSAKLSITLKKYQIW